jgi:hypothetical protein
MTTLPNLPDAPVDAADDELLYVRPPSGAVNAKRTFGSMRRNVLGRTAQSPVGFFGATAVAQPSGASQVAAPPAPVAVAGNTYTTAERDLINALKDQVNALTVLCNAQRAALVALGLIKGSA